VLTYKIAYIVQAKHIPVSRILAVTFTNKAANEMKERLVKISEDIASAKQEKKTTEKIQENDNDSIMGFLDSVTSSNETPITEKFESMASLKRIGTFHSIFLKILKEDVEKLGMKYNKNFGIFDTNESQSVLKEVLKKLNLQEIFKVPEAKNFISKQKNN
jgi:DNA helicase-2/ATP-dependent DNA helicase PcrA